MVLQSYVLWESRTLPGLHLYREVVSLLTTSFFFYDYENLYNEYLNYTPGVFDTVSLVSILHKLKKSRKYREILTYLA